MPDNLFRRKTYKTGFSLKSASCSVCFFQGKALFDFYGLKEDLIYEMQDAHDGSKPIACSGKLTVIFDHALMEE